MFLGPRSGLVAVTGPDLPGQGRTGPRRRRRHGAHASAPAGAPATAGPTPVGWRESIRFGPLDVRQVSSARWGVPAPAAGIVRGRAEPVKAFCARRATAPVELPGERTREYGLDRTCPDLELAAIESRDTSGPGRLDAYGTTVRHHH
jgi:hypothetical protein